MIRVTFLGTAASRPTVGRNVSAIAVQREGESFLFDCGEGTQRQMMRFGTGFAVDGIFITHLHADHFLGLIGLVRTLGLQGRTHPLRLFGPPGSERVLREAIHLGVDRVSFPIETRELEPGSRMGGEGYDVEAFATWHGVPAVGYALREHPRPGRFDVDRARELGVPEGPLFGRLHAGETIEVDGVVVRPEEIVGKPRPGRTIVYTGDTRPCRGTAEAARGADLLIHDATFGQDEAKRAHETFHATARGAAELARTAGAHRLVLTHLSARYAANATPLEREARKVFSATIVAYDGLVLEIPYRDGTVDGGESEGESETATKETTA